MSTLTLELHEPRFPWPAWREHSFALGVAVVLHIGLAFVLLNLSHNAPMPPVVSAVITTQLVSLPAPAVQPPSPPVTPPMPEVEAAEPAPLPEPVVEAPQVQEADLALKRVQQERQERQERQQRIEQERQQQRREEALRQEAMARQERQRQARLQEQQLAQARQAEAERLAAAAAAARAEAEAASRQYLPIAKDAPDYPQRALDRKIEGECTVAYRVNARGRVEDPQVVGECHPLFVKPSLAAAKSFRYQPKVVNGQAVAVANVKNTFTYKIQ